MESLNLHTLASSLPAAQHNTEELTNNFRAAALSITTLYKSSRKNSKRAYSTGYAAACQDLLTMIQQGVSASSHEPNQGEGLTIGRVMDWTEARLEAIKAREEEEDEEEEKEKEKEKGGKTKTTVTVAAPKVDHKPTKAKTQPLPTRNSPPISEASSPSSPPQPPAALRPIQRPFRPRPPLAIAKTDFVPGSMDFDFDLLNDPASATPTPIPLAAGAKRRHAMMMMLDAAPSPASVSLDDSALHPHPSPSNISAAAAAGGGGGAGSSRRRTRRQQSQHQHQHNQNLGPNGNQNSAIQEAMDIEDEGRERKRVARR